MAQITQLMMEYDPQPPFNAGSPETANQSVVGSFSQLATPFVEAFWTGIRK